MSYLYEFLSQLERMWVATKIFKVEALLGSGGFSVVFRLLKQTLSVVWQQENMFALCRLITTCECFHLLLYSS